jgi:hypothetical protein
VRARKRDLIGRRIVDVDWRRFPRDPDDADSDMTTDPVLTLDNGVRLTFVVSETETGEYGVGIYAHKPDPKP